MDNTNLEVYKQLKTNAQIVFSQLKNIDVRTYTPAELAQYTAIKDDGAYKCKKPEAVRFRAALDEFIEKFKVEKGQEPVYTIEHGSFSCSVGAKSLFYVFNEFEKLAEIPKSQRETFTYIDLDSNDEGVVCYITLKLPKNLNVATKIAAKPKSGRPNLELIWINTDTDNGHVWCSDTFALYAHKHYDCKGCVDDDWKEFHQWPITTDMAKKFSGNSVVLRYYKDGTIVMTKQTATPTIDIMSAKVDDLKVLLSHAPDFKRVVPKVDPKSKLCVDMDHYDKFKMLVNAAKTETIGLEVDESHPYLKIVEIDDAQNVCGEAQVALEGLPETTIKGAFSSSLFKIMVKDTNGVIYHNGHQRALIVESKDNDGFYIMMPKRSEGDYLTNYTETINPNIDYMEIRKESPMMETYKKFKSDYPDTLILFKVGPVYEAMKEDAITVSNVLGISSYQRKVANGETIDLVGFPCTLLEENKQKLEEAGYTIELCESLDVSQQPTQAPEPITAEPIAEPAAPAEPEPIPEPIPEPTTEPVVEPTTTEPEPIVEPSEPIAEPEPIEEPEPSLASVSNEELTLAYELFKGLEEQARQRGLRVVTSQYKPIIPNVSGKLVAILRDATDRYYYADIASEAPYLYVCERKFDTIEMLAEIAGINLHQPPTNPVIPTPTTPMGITNVMSVSELKEMFKYEYNMAEYEAKAQAEKVYELVMQLNIRKDVTFWFTKKDGSVREAHGTLWSELMPAPKGGGKPLDKKFQLYYDLEKKALRSFEKANLIRYDVEFK